MELDRRNFLKGAFATGAVVAGGAALASCSPSGSTENGSSAEAPSTGNAVSGSPEGNKVVRTWEMTPEPISDVAETKDYDIVMSVPAWRASPPRKPQPAMARAPLSSSAWARSPSAA